VIFKVKLTNDCKLVTFDREIFEWLTSEPYLSKIDFINNLKVDKYGDILFQSFSAGQKPLIIHLSTLLISEFFQSYLSFSENSNLNHLNGDFLDFTLSNLILEIDYKSIKI